MGPRTIPAKVSLLQATAYWLKLGCISFGGPTGQIALMHQDLVENKRWISEQRFLHALNFCMVLPGPEAQQLATYIGWLMHKTSGGIIAGVLFVLPSLFLLIGLSWIYLAYGTVPAVVGVLHGIKPAVIAIVFFAAYRIGKRALKNTALYTIAAMAFIALFFLNMPFPAIILGAGMIGAIGGRLYPAQFSTGGVHATAQSSNGALIDDTSPTPPHARFSWPRVVRVIVCGVILWAAPMAALAALFGLEHTLSQMGWFFTKAALLTFGGAYAVLPYVFQGGVEQYLWLTASQMIDGLALGETTPGPLIMVVTFIGFVGGWTRQLFGPDNLVMAGIVAGIVVTYFTFLPGFIMIFLGAPLIETTHGNLKFTAPLTAITAAVVGVILNLAVFFALHVLWPGGTGSGVDYESCAIGIAALLVIWRFNAAIIPVIGACGLAGLLLSMHGA
jgi:chromate transporter